MKILSLYLSLTVLLALVGCGESQPKVDPYVYADLYVRYQEETGGFTAEAKLSLRDSTTGLDTAYLAPGGMAFMNSNVDPNTRDDKFVKYRQLVNADAKAIPKFTFTLPSGKQLKVEGTLKVIDTIIMGPLPTHNFGLTVYPLDPLDTLGKNETLSALWQPNNESAKLGTIVGPTQANSGYVFARNSVADWPLGQGKLSFIRRRVTKFEQDGAVVLLSEEVYTEPLPSSVVN